MMLKKKKTNFENATHHAEFCGLQNFHLFKVLNSKVVQNQKQKKQNMNMYCSGIKVGTPFICVKKKHSSSFPKNNKKEEEKKKENKGR